MNFVLARHPNYNGRYLFKVPESTFLDAGTLIACDTARGQNQPAVCLTASFHGDPDVVCPLWGTTVKKLKPVTKVLREFLIDWGEELPFTEPNAEDEDEFPY